jgi:hypothetical protein
MKTFPPLKDLTGDPRENCGRLLQHHHPAPSVCPEKIKITDNATLPSKERVVDDPLAAAV